MKHIIKSLTSATLAVVLSMVAIPTFATPVFAAGAYCEIKLNPDGTAYTACSGDGSTTDEEWFAAAQQAVTDYETATNDYVEATMTGVVHSVSKPEPSVEPTPNETPVPVHTCQDDGYSSDYYWSENAQACVTDYVEPTTAPTPVPTQVATPKPTVTPTAKPTTTPTVKPVTTPKPTVNPTSTPTSIPSTTPTTSSWNYTKVSASLLTLINNQRVANGVKPLLVVETAVTDATHRAMESMEFAKETTAYGTTTDGHVGFDTEIGDTEVNSYVTHLNGTETEEEVANIIFTSITTGLGKALAPFSDTYKTVGIGFADSHFTSRLGRDLGYNVWFNLQLNK